MENYYNTHDTNKALKYIRDYHLNDNFGDTEAYERLVALLEALMPTIKSVDGLNLALKYISSCELYIYGYRFLIRNFITIANRNILANSNQSEKYPINFKARKEVKERRPRARKYPTNKGGYLCTAV